MFTVAQTIGVVFVGSHWAPGVSERATTMFPRACPPRASAFVATSARFAVSALFALATASPGASWLTWFLAMFLTCFFSFLLRMLLIAEGAAIAVPANATIRASAATIIAGDGRRP